MSVGPGDFAPYQDLAEIALPLVAADPAHDAGHLLRVWRSVTDIVESDGLDVDLRALAAAALLHDCVDLGKGHPDRALSSRLAAERAAAVVGDRLPPAGIAVMRGAIAAHSFSANLPILTTEDAVLRDADRLDSIGAVGIARLFATTGVMGRALYHAGDPRAEDRPLDDVAYALDHFRTKILGLPAGFLTRRAIELAGARAETTLAFLSAFEAEIGAVSAPSPRP